MIEEPTKEEIQNLNTWLSLNWIPLLSASFILFMLVPYFISPFVFIIENPMDEALIQFLGESLVKPFLYLGFLLGCLLSWIPIRFYRSLFSKIRITGECKLEKARHGAAIIAPFFGMLSQLIYGVISRITPGIESYEWGPVVNLFFVLPALGFMIVSSLGWIVIRWRTEYLERTKIHFLRIMGEEKTFLLVSKPNTERQF